MLQIIRPSYSVFELVCTDGTVLRRVEIQYGSIRAHVTAGYILRECADALPTTFSRELTPSTLLNKDIELVCLGYDGHFGPRYGHDLRDIAPGEFKKWVITDELELEIQSRAERLAEQGRRVISAESKGRPELTWMDTRTPSELIRDVGRFTARDTWLAYTNWANAPQ